MTNRFAAGDRVRVRLEADPPSVNPRTPPYARGLTATVIAAHGIVPNPLDHHSPYPPLYTLRFQGRDISGETSDHIVIAEVHEEWLEPARENAGQT